MSEVGNSRTALDFFAGSGLVSEGLSPFFATIWANDICEKKAAVFCANHSWKAFTLGPIEGVKGERLPEAGLSWASFPCQDLSLAGNANGIHASRSGLVWQWLRILDEMPEKPKVLVAENVVGLVSTRQGEDYRALHLALHKRGYRVGAVALDAVHFVPQSRPRIFVIAVANDATIPAELLDKGPNWLHSKAVVSASNGLPDLLWWKTPLPPKRKRDLIHLVEWDAPVDPPERLQRNLELLSPRHREHLLAASQDPLVATGYRRTRNGKQVLELRFDGVAGCLRTPDGGSSRQLLIMKHHGAITTRLLTIREAARLMGAPDKFQLPGTYNDGYRAMGDAVAAPVAKFLGKHILTKLLEASYV